MIASPPITEIFSSIQGEGMRVGERHIFVRFNGCNLSCSYCDTLQGKNAGIPYTLKQCLHAITHVPFPYHLHTCVSFTGGEPLLASSFIKHMSPAIHERGLLVYLETNGTLPKNLRTLSIILILFRVIINFRCIYKLMYGNSKKNV